MKKEHGSSAADRTCEAVQPNHVWLIPGYQENHISKVIHAVTPMSVSRLARGVDRASLLRANSNEHFCSRSHVLSQKATSTTASVKHNNPIPHEEPASIELNMSCTFHISLSVLSVPMTNGFVFGIRMSGVSPCRTD